MRFIRRYVMAASYVLVFLGSAQAQLVTGGCGSSNGASFTSAPTANLCNSGTASTVSGSGPWSWSCFGNGRGTTAICSALELASAQSVSGACGSSNGASFTSAPTANLCTAGAALTVSGSGPWYWNCAGSNGGVTMSCSASIKIGSSGSSDPAVGLLPSDRDASANWKMAGLVSVGGIPNRTTICATVSPSGGDDTSNIQTAINNCPSGQVVLLSVGTFTISGTLGSGVNFVKINKSITVRGSGPCAGAAGITRIPQNSPTGSVGYPASPSMSKCTLIQRADGASINTQGPGYSSHFVMGSDIYNVYLDSPTALAADGAAGATTIQVASTSAFSAGQVVGVYEHSRLGWQTSWIWSGEMQWSSPDYRIGWRAQNPTCQPDDEVCAGGSTNPGIPCYFSFNNGGLCDVYTDELKQIASIGPGPCPGTSCTITFDTPLTISYRTSYTASVGILTQHPNGVQTAPVTYVGLENMTLQNGDTANISMMACLYCWVKNVEDDVYAGGSIRITAGFRDQVEEVYDHMSAVPVQGGAGYNWTLDNATSETLVENSISMLADKVDVVRASGAGSVFAYNYFDDGFDGVAAYYGTEAGANAGHWMGSHHVLFEGNWTWAIDNDNTWGSTPFITSFRNDVTGFRTKFIDYAYKDVVVDDINNLPQRAAPGSGPYENNVHTIGPSMSNYWQSYIGNVLGTSGAMANWLYQSSAPAVEAIWNTGYTGGGDNSEDLEVWSQQGSASACVTTTGDQCPLIHLSNYDYLTNSLADPSNPTLPNSFYVSSAPTFFSNGSGYTWPWVNSEGSTKVQHGPTTSACTTNVGGPCSGLPAKARMDNGTPFTQP